MNPTGSSSAFLYHLGETAWCVVGRTPGRETVIVAQGEYPRIPLSADDWLKQVQAILPELPACPKDTLAVLHAAGLPVITRNIQVPKVAPEAQEEAIRFEAKEALPYDLHDVEWDVLELADDGVELQYALAAVRLTWVGPLIAALKGRSVRVSENVVTTLLDGVGLSPERPTLRVNLGAFATGLSLADKGSLLLRTISTGHGNVEPEQLPATYATRLAGEINRSLIAFRQSGVDVDNLAVELAGPGLIYEGVGSQMLKLLRARDVQILDTAPFTEPADYESARALDLSTAWEKAHQRFGGRLLNLVPGRRGAAAAIPINPALVMAGAACLFLAGTIALGGTLVASQRIEREDRAVTAVLTPAESLHSELTSYRKIYDEQVAELQALQLLSRNRAEWVRFLDDLQKRLVSIEHVWIDQFTVMREGEWPAEGEPIVDPVRSEEEAAGVVSLILVRGRMIDRNNPTKPVSNATHQNVNRLIAHLEQSVYVARVVDRKFDASLPGILKFEFSLQCHPDRPL